MYRSERVHWLPILAVVLSTAFFSSARAVPYASAVRNLSGDMWEFVLNENAGSYSIIRDGGSPIVVPNPTSGRYTFDMSGFTNFEISVSNTASSGWTRISDAGNAFTNFERPSGLVVNTNPGSQYFGTVYVNNSTDFSTVSGRPMGDGIYPMTANLRGVDLTTYAEITDPNDVTQAKLPPGWTVSGASASAWRMTLDEADNLIVSDWSDANGGIKYSSADLTGGGLILDIQSGPTYGVLNSQGQPFHGSIVSKPTVTGSVGNGLTVWGMDEDLESVFLADNGNHIWRWDVGNATNYEGTPQLVVNVENLPPSTEGGLTFLSLNVGVLANAHYSPQFDKWYLTENRSEGVEAGLVVVTADGIDGNMLSRRLFETGSRTKIETETCCFWAVFR